MLQEIEQKQIREIKVAFPFSMKQDFKYGEKYFHKIKAHLAALFLKKYKPCVFLTGFFQVDDIQSANGADSRQDVNVQAFHLDVMWLKKVVDIFLELDQPFEITSLPQIMFIGLKDTKKIHDLFVQPTEKTQEALTVAKEITLKNIDEWAKNIQEFLENEKNYDEVFPEKEKKYQSVEDRVSQLNKVKKKSPRKNDLVDLALRYQATFKRMLSSVKVATRSYLEAEMALYFWFIKKKYDYTIYLEGNNNSVLQFTEKEILKNKMPHLILTEENVLEISSPSPTTTPRAHSDASNDNSPNTTPSTSPEKEFTLATIMENAMEENRRHSDVNNEKSGNSFVSIPEKELSMELSIENVVMENNNNNHESQVIENGSIKKIMSTLGSPVVSPRRDSNKILEEVSDSDKLYINLCALVLNAQGVDGMTKFVKGTFWSVKSEKKNSKSFLFHSNSNIQNK